MEEEVSVPRVLDHVRARAGVGGVDHRRAPLLEAETDALHAVVHQKGCDFGVTRDGRLAGNKFGPAEAVAEPVRDARDGEGQ